MDSQSVKELKSWVRRKLWVLRRDVSIETHRKMADLSKEFATCVRLQREQMYTLMQMHAHTREAAIENLLRKHTSETGGEQLPKMRGTDTTEDRMTDVDERQSARRNQAMDSISELRTEEDEIKREKEGEVTERKREKGERKRMLTGTTKEEIIQCLEEEKWRKDTPQKELERKRKEEEGERKRQEDILQYIDIEIKSETDRWESKTDPEEKENSQVPAPQRWTPKPCPATIKLQKENINMAESEEEEEKKKMHPSGMERLMKLMRTKSQKVLSLQCAENTSKEEKQQRKLERKRKQEEEKSEMKEKRKEEKRKKELEKKRKREEQKREQEETRKRELEKKRREEERQKLLEKRELEEKRKLEEWKKELEKKMKEEEDKRWQKDSSENIAVELNSESDGWESKTDSEEEKYNTIPGAQSRTPSRRSVTFKLPEEKIHESEEEGEEDTTPMSGLGRVIKLMRTTSQRVLSLQSGRSNFEVSRRRCVYRPPETPAEPLLHHAHTSSGHLRGALPCLPGPSRGHRPGTALYPHSAGWSYTVDQAKRARRRLYPQLTSTSADQILTSGHSKHTTVLTSPHKFTYCAGADLRLVV